MGGGRRFDLDGRDFLAAGDDDVLHAVAQLYDAVGVHHSDVAGVEPAAAEGLLGRLRVGEIALHHDIAAHHDLAHRLPVGGHVVHLIVDDPHFAGEGVAEALPGTQSRLLLRR